MLKASRIRLLLLQPHPLNCEMANRRMLRRWLGFVREGKCLGAHASLAPAYFRDVQVDWHCLISSSPVRVAGCPEYLSK